MKNGILTFFFAFVPGAGQMYQGYMKRGLSLISIFCLGILAAIIIPPFLAVLPIVWMYSFFDTFNLRAQMGSGVAPEDDYLVHIESDVHLKKLLSRSHTLVGWVLVVLGVYVLYDSFLMSALRNNYLEYGNPLVGMIYRFCKSLPTLAVCIALIGVGVWLVRGPKQAQEPDDPDDDVHYYGTALEEHKEDGDDDAE